MNHFTMKSLRRRLALGACVALGLFSATAYAWPDRPIRIVVPFEAGGTTDLLARMVAEGIAPDLGQSVVVSNKGGAGGNIGASEVARAPADGYTLLFGTPGTQVINGLVYANPGYDPQGSFAPVAYVARVANVVLTTPRSGLKDMSDVLKAAREKPGALNWGTPGIGSSGHLSLELIRQMAKIDITHVPYKGAGQARVDLLSGTIDLQGDNLPTAMKALEQGQLVALGVSSANADPRLPNVKPIAATIPGYELTSWFVVMAPAGTPAAVVDKLNGSIQRWLALPATRSRLDKLAATPVGGTPADLAAHLAREQSKYQALVKSAGITPQ